MKTCPKCGRENKDSNKFCIGCGTKLEELPRFCPDCGAELETDSRFCPQCGTKIDDEQRSTSGDKQIEVEKDNLDNYSLSELLDMEMQSNSADIQNKLGDYYRSIWKTEEDKEEAFCWYTKSAEQGNAGGEWRLGSCYYYGYGIEEDLEEAFYWYGKSAEQDNDEGQWRLGNCYYYGYGTEKNEEEALNLYNQSIEQGNIDAKNKLEKLKEFAYLLNRKGVGYYSDSKKTKEQMLNETVNKYLSFINKKSVFYNSAFIHSENELFRDVISDIAKDANLNEILGYIDTTQKEDHGLFSGLFKAIKGKSGLVFTKNALYGTSVDGRTWKIPYFHMDSIDFDGERLFFEEDNISIDGTYYNIDSLEECLNEIYANLDK